MNANIRNCMNFTKRYRHSWKRIALLNDKHGSENTGALSSVAINIVCSGFGGFDRRQHVACSVILERRGNIRRKREESDTLSIAWEVRRSLLSCKAETWLA